MKKRLFSFVWAALLLAAMALPAGADTGPKPSVEVAILGLEGRDCWATLLSEVPSNGPNQSLWRENEEGEWVRKENVTPWHSLGDPEYPAWSAFRAWEEEQQDWFFLQEVWDASEGSFRWGYYPPSVFQIALWFPEEDALVLSGACERYAFDSYYTLDLTGVELEPGGAVTGLSADHSYDYVWQGISLVLRFALTVAIEYAIAWLIGLRSPRQQAVILAVNLVTQLVLNIGLNWIAYQDGAGQLFLRYAVMELGVFGVETALYSWTLPTPERTEQQRAALLFGYAAGANLASFVIGWILAYMIPGIF